MDDAKRTPRNASSADAPSRNDARNDVRCGLCDKPITAQEASRLHIANSPHDRTYNAHAKCIHEKGMTARAMRPAK